MWVTSISTFGAIWTWIIILISQMKFRKTLSKTQVSKLSYKAYMYPFGSYFAIAFLLLVIVLMGVFPDTRIALEVGPVWILLLIIFYYTKYKKA